MGAYRDVVATAEVEAEGRSPTGSRSRGADGDLVCSAHRLPVGISAAGDGLRLRHDMLASVARLARTRRVGNNLAALAGRVRIGRRDRLVQSGDRQLFGASCFWGA